MSRREHGVLRVGALVVLALCAWLPRGVFSSADAASSTVTTSATVSVQPPAATYATVAWTAPVSR
jgi:hypothetical protein